MSQHEIEPIGMNDAGMTALINNLGRDCLPEQYIREFTKNCIEAILRAKESKGVIVIDTNWVDWYYMENNPTYISFTDNGIGMSPSEMSNLLNKLSSSSGIKLDTENYGVGAKISALPRNKAGIKYESWQNGVGYMAVMIYDQKIDRYGMMRFQDEEGNYKNYFKLDDGVKPDTIDQHGTRVTLQGNIIGEDTMKRPEGIGGTKDFWLLYYLNKKFYKINDNITLKVRCDYSHNLQEAKFDSKKNRIIDPSSRNCLRIVKGHHESLKSYAEKTGEIDLSDAKVSWMILKKDRQTNSREFTRGHTAIIKDGEVFDLSSGSANKASAFGLIFSAPHVALHIKPNNSYSQNTARSGIVKIVDNSGTTLPWERWQNEFISSMPKELKEFEDEASKSLNNETSDNIIERLSKYARFFKLSKYKRSLSGKFLSEDEVEDVTGHIRQGERRENPEPTKTTKGDTVGQVKQNLSLYAKSKGEKSVKVFSNPFPEFTWVHLNNGRDENEMEDRAARYVHEAFTIKGNKDFVGFKDVLDDFLKVFGDKHPQAPELINTIVYDVYKQHLIETVAGALTLTGRKHWNDDDFKNSVSEESLTSSIMIKYYLLDDMERQIKTKLKVSKEDNLSIKVA